VKIHVDISTDVCPPNSLEISGCHGETVKTVSSVA